MRFWTSILTFWTVSGGWFALEASLIKVVRKFLHFFTLSMAELDSWPPELDEELPWLFPVAFPGNALCCNDAFAAVAPLNTVGEPEAIITGEPDRVVETWGLLTMAEVLPPTDVRTLPCWAEEVTIPGCNKDIKQYHSSIKTVITVLSMIGIELGIWTLCVALKFTDLINDDNSPFISVNSNLYTRIFNHQIIRILLCKYIVLMFWPPFNWISKSIQNQLMAQITEIW